MKFELDKSLKHDEDLPKTFLISGHSMIRLKLSEFQFLWGLSLLVLFQGQQLVSGNQGKLLLVHDEKKYSADSMPQGVHYLSSFEIALLVFQSLSKEVFFSQEFLSLDLCKELLQVKQCLLGEILSIRSRLMWATQSIFSRARVQQSNEL